MGFTGAGESASGSSKASKMPTGNWWGLVLICFDDRKTLRTWLNPANHRPKLLPATGKSAAPEQRTYLNLKLQP